ncbi:MAG: hypothetical protein ABJC13_09185 [Acidobacteriota bacterium]
MAPFTNAAELSQTRSRKSRRLNPAATGTLVAAAVLLIVSYWLPYWQIELVTRAQPQGVKLISYLGRLDGALPEVLSAAGWPGDGQGEDLAALERSLSLALVVVVGLLLTAAYGRRRWTALLAVPAICFPFIVVADTARWLVSILATLSPVPGRLHVGPAFLLLGRLAIAGATLDARPSAGFILAAFASMTGLAGLWLSRAPRRGAKPTSLP